MHEPPFLIYKLDLIMSTEFSNSITYGLDSYKMPQQKIYEEQMDTKVSGSWWSKSEMAAIFL